MKTTNIPKILLRILGIPALILMILFIIMQFSSEMKWDESDFIMVGVLLVIAGSVYEFLIKKSGKYQVIAGYVIALLALWLYAELAVGLFTNWGS